MLTRVFTRFLRPFSTLRSPSLHLASYREQGRSSRVVSALNKLREKRNKGGNNGRE